MSRTAVIIGAGPAGLTCALELLRRTDIKPIVLEAGDGVGGISRTFHYKGNHIDIGGHRFFSKVDRVMDWWAQLLPLQGPSPGVAGANVSYQNKSRWIDMPADGPDPNKVDDVMLVRPRTSRILYRRRLLAYPVSMSLDTLSKLGIMSAVRILFSYVYARVFPIRNEQTLEQFFINRFGHELYATFFRDYTEKVWGARCSEIPAEWGAQRIKGLSLSSAVVHAVKSVLNAALHRSGGVRQKKVETSLIEQFLYPKFGPGQMWETAKSHVERLGGRLHLKHRVAGIATNGGNVTGVLVVDQDGVKHEIKCDFVFSTMPIRDLIAGMSPAAPAKVREVSDGLVYRDFITVGLLLDRLKMGGNCKGRELFDRVPDNWIYVQEPDVKVGRLQFFNNWSPYMVADPDKIWLGLEYFCNEGDELWSMNDGQFAEFAKEELERIGIINRADVVDHTVIRVPKTYPAYFGTYDRFATVREYVDGFDNLYLLGRNGMHRYNNQDHSMLTAMVAVDNIVAGVPSKDNVWSVNTEMDYHEGK